MAAARDNECLVLRAANKCAWLLRRADSLHSRAEERLTANADGLLSSAKELLTARADSLHSRAEERLTAHADGLLSSARQEAMSVNERAASNSSDVREEIQNLPKELREIIYKEYVVIKQRERAALGWNRLYEEMAVAIKLRERAAFGWDELHEEIVACIAAVDSCAVCACAVCTCGECICNKCQSDG